MSEGDKDLERLKAKRLAEMRDNISSQRQQEKITASQKEEQGKKPPTGDCSKTVGVSWNGGFTKRRVSVSQGN